MAQRNDRRSQDLCGPWEFSFSRDELGSVITVEGLRQLGLPTYSAQVPGNFELDLLANGLITGDPFHGLNIAGLRSYEGAQVWYHRRFQADPDTGLEAELVFEGLDCIADIYLNSALLASTDNMLIEHRIPVTGLLRVDNELLIHIQSPTAAAQQYDYTPSLNATGASYDSLFVRKAPHMYGWDIMPRALSAGLWRPVRLEYKPDERIEDVYLLTKSVAEDRSCAELALWFRVQTRAQPEDRYELRLEARCGRSGFVEQWPLACGAGWARFGIADPMLWWPKGRGQPSLYATTVYLLKNGECLDSRTFATGIRTIRLSRTSTTDEAGEGDFCFMINGERIFVHGSNWVPMDAYHSRDIARIPQALALAEDLNCNMLRCWGGNVYENDLFYDLCDQKGILVWQDFAMACAVYPQSPEFQERIAAEVRSVVRRLRQHPCLALWAGDNECDQAYGWGAVQTDPNSNALTRRTIPAVLQQEDPERPYLPSSPYIDSEAYRKGDKYLPEDHLWGPRDYYKGEFYRNALCHFVSEIGYHACPDPQSLAEFLSPDKLWPWQDNAEWQLHSTSPIPGMNFFSGRVELMGNQIRALFGGIPDNLADYVQASQITQAEALKFFIERFRSQMPRTTGILWWNLIDGWPQFSDAVVDYFFRRKTAYGFIKTAQQPVLLVVKEPTGPTQEGMQELVAVNNTRTDLDLNFSVTDASSGVPLTAGRQVAGADQVTPLAVLPYAPEEQRFYLLDWQAGETYGVSHYLCGAPPFQFSAYQRWLETLRSKRAAEEIYGVG